jgi:hypothetical protein
MHIRLPFQVVFNATGPRADSGRVIRAAAVVSGAVALFLTIMASLADRAPAVP